jgi:hypothetical protein
MNIYDTIQTKYECIFIQVESTVKDVRSERSKEKEELETHKDVQQSKREEITMSTELIILIVVLVLLFGGGGGYYWSRRG